ncbi:MULTISPECIES: tRNA glutamyl-Q(34) synthetase GluQRS [unclassified Moraxella]|uniref:tRNA glutamyl-Q(34) synthetase GluQRS n=1 Tax=unclassified Moraxella TaxID=2685852 RepID=UPI003AF7D028
MAKSSLARTDNATNSVIGRFAPSPTGLLHLGSLLTAVTSFCIAKQQHGQWLVRMEDVDSERCQSHFADAILADLERLGLYWDGAVRYQSQHLEHYHHVLDTELLHVSYGCGCSRKSLQTYWQSHPHANSQTNLPYPQLCYTNQLPRTHAVRLIMPNQQMLFYDTLQGVITGNPQQQQGDIVVRRQATAQLPQGMINYMLAVVLDDAIQGVTQIVRGLDILPLTLPQLAIMDYLALPYPTSYYHLPILLNADGQKLSKQTLAEPISQYSPQVLLTLVLKLLGQPPVATDYPQVMLQQAISQWDNRPLIGCKTIEVQGIGEMLKG